MNEKESVELVEVAGGIKIDPNELLKFILAARRRGYASGVDPARMPDGSKVIVTRASAVGMDQPWTHEDKWVGSERSWGREKVGDESVGRMIWIFQYGGGLTPNGVRLGKDPVIQCLKAALKAGIELSLPRGRSTHCVAVHFDRHVERLTYYCHQSLETSPWVMQSHGDEWIEGLGGSKLFDHSYHGGIVR